MCTLGGRQCKTVSISGLPILVHPTKHGRFLLRHRNKSPQMHKIWVKVCNSSNLWLVASIFSFPSIICADRSE